jgi:hypothetical protein
VYGLDPDTQRVGRFKATLAGSPMDGVTAGASQWRDPLVAALFGTGGV